MAPASHLGCSSSLKDTSGLIVNRCTAPFQCINSWRRSREYINTLMHVPTHSHITTLPAVLLLLYIFPLYIMYSVTQSNTWHLHSIFLLYTDRHTRIIDFTFLLPIKCTFFISYISCFMWHCHSIKINKDPLFDGQKEDWFQTKPMPERHLTCWNTHRPSLPITKEGKKVTYKSSFGSRLLHQARWTSQQDDFCPHKTTKWEGGGGRQHNGSTPKTPPITTTPAHHASSRCLSLCTHAPPYKKILQKFSHGHSHANKLALTHTQNCERS